MSDNRFRDNTDEAEFEDLSLSEREEILRSEARRRYVARQEHQRRKKTQNTLATVGKIFVATLVIFIILAYILFNIVSDKKKNRDKGIKAFNKGDYEEAIDWVREQKRWAAEERQLERENRALDRELARIEADCNSMDDEINDQVYRAYREERAAYDDFIASLDMGDD